QEVRLHLCLQQAQPGDRQFLFRCRLRRRRLLATATAGHALGDGTGDRLDILEVDAVVDLQPVAPRRTLRLADEAETAAAVAAADGRQDAVALADDPAHRVVATQLREIVGIGVTRGGAYLQMVARTVDAVDARQFADRGVEQ